MNFGIWILFIEPSRTSMFKQNPTNKRQILYHVINICGIKTACAVFFFIKLDSPNLRKYHALDGNFTEQTHLPQITPNKGALTRRGIFSCVIPSGATRCYGDSHK